MSRFESFVTGLSGSLFSVRSTDNVMFEESNEKCVIMFEKTPILFLNSILKMYVSTISESERRLKFYKLRVSLKIVFRITFSLFDFSSPSSVELFELFTYTRDVTNFSIIFGTVRFNFFEFPKFDARKD